MRLLPGIVFTGIVFVSSARAQEVQPTPGESPDIKPSWETQKQVAEYALSIPPPRGQITDRNGQPLAQNRVSYNLSVVFPTPLDFTDDQVTQYVNRQISSAKTLTSRPISWTPEAAIQHYRNRGNRTNNRGVAFVSQLEVPKGPFVRSGPQGGGAVQQVAS